MSIRKNDWTKEDLVRNGITVEWRDGQPVVKQVYQMGKRNRISKWNVERPIYLAKCNHKYSTDRFYPMVSLKIYGQYKTIILSNLVWMWEVGEIGDYDIDHIDGDPMNNSLDNLQKITHKENLEKRKGEKNQWKFIKDMMKS